MARPSDGTQPKGGKKNRKYGRNRKWCEAYRQAGTRMKNKIRKLKRRIKRFPNDTGAKQALARYV